MNKGPYTVTSSKQIYQNPWITVQEDTVIRPDGKEGIFTTVDNGTGVSVVALDKENNIYLVKEYFYVLSEYGIQTPSGGVDDGETPLQAAQKELLEETGLVASTWHELGMVNALTMIIRSPSYLFIAQEVEQKQEPEEGIEVIKMPFIKAFEMVMKSEITHGPSCVAILKAKEFIRQAK
ncbi:MAG TPA: NUDIX hydrolase [Candidatus Andersenbacteria bacterium]|nr:NUDIX hydrolase [Candidatus Andersenbacteria bacterium]